MPLPALYQMLSILFFLSGCFWVFILKKNGTEQVCKTAWPQILKIYLQVFRIHWIMAALVFLKSLSLFFHGVRHKASNIHCFRHDIKLCTKLISCCPVWLWSFLQVNYTKIAANGIHEESWAILYYVTHLLKVNFGSNSVENLKKLFWQLSEIFLGWSSVLHHSLDRLWMGLCEACVEQQWEESFHGGLASPGIKHLPWAIEESEHLISNTGHIQRCIHYPGRIRSWWDRSQLLERGDNKFPHYKND